MVAVRECVKERVVGGRAGRWRGVLCQAESLVGSAEEGHCAAQAKVMEFEARHYETGKASPSLACLRAAANGTAGVTRARTLR